jgi:hypothetical protein
MDEVICDATLYSLALCSHHTGSHCRLQDREAGLCFANGADRLIGNPYAATPRQCWPA